jgi:hypothetical protein
MFLIAGCEHSGILSSGIIYSSIFIFFIEFTQNDNTAVLLRTLTRLKCVYTNKNSETGLNFNSALCQHEQLIQEKMEFLKYTEED